MDKCTHEVRAAHWRNIIQGCQQRPEGQSAKQWLDENQIREQSYYYWLRKLRNEAYSEIEESNLSILPTSVNEITFTEVLAPTTQASASLDQVSDCIMPTAVIKTLTMSIAISNDIAEPLLTKILQEVSHA